MVSNLEQNGVEQEKNISVSDLDKFNIELEFGRAVEKSIFFNALNRGHSSSDSYLVIPKDALVDDSEAVETASLPYVNQREKLSQAQFVDAKTKYTKAEVDKLFSVGNINDFFEKYGADLANDDFIENGQDIKEDSIEEYIKRAKDKEGI